MNTSPLIHQLKGKGAIWGSRRGKISPTETARESFSVINNYITNSGGSDQNVTRCLAEGIRQCLDLEKTQVIVEKPHPWLGSIRPDIQIEIDNNKIICIEMFYTAKAEPRKLADYVLKKLDRYMKEIDAYIEAPQRHLL